ncbi:M17 family peptidase N-terminal domain-containing protein, partial [Planomonospora algeriensis]
MTTVRLNSSDNVVSFDTEALVVGVHTGPDGLRAAPGAEGLDEALGGRLAATLGAMGVKGKPGEIAKVPTFGALTAPLLVAVGLGDAPEGTTDPSPAPRRGHRDPRPGRDRPRRPRP